MDNWIEIASHGIKSWHGNPECILNHYIVLCLLLPNSCFEWQCISDENAMCNSCCCCYCCCGGVGVDVVVGGVGGVVVGGGSGGIIIIIISSSSSSSNSSSSSMNIRLAIALWNNLHIRWIYCHILVRMDTLVSKGTKFWLPSVGDSVWFSIWLFIVQVCVLALIINYIYIWIG